MYYNYMYIISIQIYIYNFKYDNRRKLSHCLLHNCNISASDVINWQPVHCRGVCGEDSHVNIGAFHLHEKESCAHVISVGDNPYLSMFMQIRRGDHCEWKTKLTTMKSDSSLFQAAVCLPWKLKTKQIQKWKSDKLLTSFSLVIQKWEWKPSRAM